MIRLISNSALSGQLLQAVLAGAVSANQPEATVTYFDMLPSDVASIDKQHGTTYQVALNSNTDVTIVSPPGAQQTGTTGQAGYVRMIDYIGIYNKDTASVTLTVKIDDAGTEKILWKGTLLTLEALYYEDGQGWYAQDANGNLKTSQNNTITGSWTPSDASGAGLVLTSLAGFYSVSNGVWDVWGQAIYPVTASGANAAIGGLPATIAAGNVSRNGFNPAFTTEATLIHLLGNAGTTNFGLYTSAGAAVTNATMSTDQLNFYGRFYT